MHLRYDKYNRVEPFRIYLGTLDNKKVCCLNGIEPESVQLQEKFNNTYQLSFTVDEYISYFGKRYKSNGYEFLGNLARIYVENVGWFIMSQPDINHDGVCETKDVKADSCDVEFVQRDLVGFKINCGTTDSYEMLDPDNVDRDEYTGVEFAKEQIKFYNPNNPKLSFLDILIKESGMTDWTVGYVDTIAKKYKSYVDGNPVERDLLLADEIPYFDVDSTSIHRFLTQDVEKYFECLILFDIDKKQINAYRVENIGKDTNIHIGFRNLQNTNSITVDESSIYTRVNVRGGDDLTIRYINFGLDQIENIEYFLNTKYLPEELIEKYKLWLSDVESARYDYIDLSRKYNEQLEIISELKDRVPLDACSTDWDSFSLEELQQKKQDYEAQKLAIEKMFTNADGEVDYDALQASDLTSDYNQITNVIIPNIENAIWNKDITSEDDKKDSIEDTDWSHYGLDELYAKMQLYEGQRSVLIKSGYNVPWTEESNNAQDYHEARYQEYLDLCNQLDPAYSGSCAEAYEQRKQEVSDAEALRDQYNSQRQEIASSVYKETWKYYSSTNDSEYISFTEKDLGLLNKLYYDTDYVNDNMFLVSSDTQVTAVDEQQKLYDAAVNDLSSTSQPQFKYSTTLDNFLAITQYSDFSKELDVGNYIRLDVRDNYQVKLRVISITFNPMIFDNDLSIEFSNMIKSKSKRTDMDDLLSSSNSISKNQISGSSNGSSTNIDDTTMRAILNKLLNSSALSNKINSSTGIGSGGSGITMSLSELETKLKKIIDLDTGDGFFNYLQAELISTGKIVSDSGEFKDLSALVAAIDNLLAGNVSAELGHILKLTAENVSISEAVIKDLIAAQITVSMLKASDISTDTFHIVSDDGGIEIAGNTMQFKDFNGVIRIQIGRDTNNEFTFCLYDETGEGVLIDSTGVHESAISDGLIKNSMIGNGEISKDKLGFYIAEANEDGTINIGQVKVDGESFEVVYNTFVKSTNNKFNSITETMSGVSSKVDSVEKAIINKAWQSDIHESINNYDGTSIKTIRDSVAENKTSIGNISNKVSEVETTVSKKADGSTVQTLSEKVSTMEQDANGFKQAVEENYATKGELSDTSTSLKSEITQSAKEINQKVSDVEGNVTSVSTKLDGVETEISDAKGSSTTLKAKLDGIDTSVIDAEKNAKSFATQEAERVQSTVTKGYQDSIAEVESNFTQRADSIEERVETAEGIIASHSTSIGEISDTVQDNLGNITKIQQSLDGVETEIENARGDKTSLSAKIGEISQSVSDVSGKYSALSSTVDGVAINVGSLQEMINQSFEFTDEGLIIKSSGTGNSNISLKLGNNRISFLDGTNEVAYISNNKLHITSASIVDSLQIGAFGFTPMSNGSLSFNKLL